MLVSKSLFKDDLACKMRCGARESVVVRQVKENAWKEKQFLTRDVIELLFLASTCAIPSWASIKWCDVSDAYVAESRLVCSSLTSEPAHDGNTPTCQQKLQKLQEIHRVVHVVPGLPLSYPDFRRPD